MLPELHLVVLLYIIVSEKVIKELKTHILRSKPIPENRAIYEMICKNVV